MPPKKKAGKKASKGKREDEAEEQEEEEGPDYSYELSLEQLLEHIQDWERRLARYQEKHRQLEQVNSQLLSAFEDSSKTRQDSVAFLKKTMEQRDDEIAELQDRLTGQRQLKEQKKEEWEQLLQRLRTEFQEMKDQLTSENNLAATKLASLEEFKRDREVIIARYNALTEEFNKMLEDHEAAKQRIHAKNLLDRDRLKKDMVTRVNHVAADFRKVSNKQMAETTKRTIRENVSIQSQMFKMSEKQVELMEENAEIRKRLREQRRRIAELERGQKESATKFACHQRIILMLRQKRKELDLLVDEFKRREAEMEAMERGERKPARSEEQREEIESLAQQLDEQESLKRAAEDDLSRAEAENEAARAGVSAAADILKQALQMPVGEADGERLLRRLRDLLAEAVAGLPTTAAERRSASRPDTAVTHHTEEDVPLDEIADADDDDEAPAAETAASADTLPEVGVPSHCKPGSLQLIPRPRQKIPTFQDKVRESAAKRTDASATLPPGAYQAYLLNRKRQQQEAEAAAAAAAAAGSRGRMRSSGTGSKATSGAGHGGNAAAASGTPSSLMRLL
uniref:Cilia- and flagella-associated protein 157 n=2 Tax=Macrostomum lignano TaxID=282301 RepID=A0A1I8IRJ6_9PLAT